MSNRADNLSYNNITILSSEEELKKISNNSESVYPMNSINVGKGFYSIYELKRKFDRKDKKIVLDSEFQRENVWKQSQKSEIIESILMGLPLPIFYFFEDKIGRLIVIDGRQRLTAFFEFLDNKFSLTKLKILPELSGKKFNELDSIAQVKIEDYQIQAHIILSPTPDRVKFDIFDRVNRAGTLLTEQEIRNALYQGNSTQLLKQICSTKEFSDATDNAYINNKRMKERYIILRFLSFELYFSNKILDDNGKIYVYRNDIDELLGKTMEYINNLNDLEVEHLRKYTVYCLRNSYYYLGKDGFRLVENGRRSPINMNILECLMHLMGNIPKEDENIKIIVKKRVEYLLNDTIFIESIRKHRDNWNNVKTRYTMVNDIIKELVNQ